MDPLDCTLDELCNKNNRKRRRNNNRYHNNYNHNNYDNTHNHYTTKQRYDYNTSATKRFRKNNDNYNDNYNGNYNNNYNDNYNANYNYNYKSKAIYRPKQNHQNPLPSEPSSNYYKEHKNNENEQENENDAQYGYVTLIMRGDNYIPGALILAHSLRLVSTAYPLIVMITDDVSANARNALELLYDYVVDVPYVKYRGKCKRMKTDKAHQKYKDWASDSFTKWNILQLNHLLNLSFSKLFFLDSDKIVIKNIDHLFSDPRIKCPAGTFSSPWTNNNNYKHKTNNKYGLIDHYPPTLKHGDEIPAISIYNSLYKNGFVAVGTGMLLKPNMNEYNKLIFMLDHKYISDEYIDNDIDKEKNKNTEENNNRMIGFKNCYSMLDEQSIVFFYYYHKVPWHYIDTKYNFIPWHFKWLENDKGVLSIPVILHFFGMKPWTLSPVTWRDLQTWWGLVFNLVNYAATDMYKWNEDQKKLISSFFKLSLINELPLDLFIEDNTNHVETKGRGFKDFNVESAEKKLKSKVTCFWCYEMAKREGMNPVELIKANEFDKIEWIFHCPIDPLSGKLCCPKLMADDEAN